MEIGAAVVLCFVFSCGGDSKETPRWAFLDSFWILPYRKSICSRGRICCYQIRGTVKFISSSHITVAFLFFFLVLIPLSKWTSVSQFRHDIALLNSLKSFHLGQLLSTFGFTTLIDDNNLRLGVRTDKYGYFGPFDKNRAHLKTRQKGKIFFNDVCGIPQNLTSMYCLST